MTQRKRFLLRLDPRLYEALERWAADELRSVNAQIELLLREQARRAGRFPKHAERARTAPARAADPARSAGTDDEQDPRH